MKLSGFILFLLVLLLGCANGSKDSNQTQLIASQIDTKVMNNERFNIQEYEKRKAEGTTEFEEEDGTLVQQLEVGKSENVNYIEYRMPPPPALFKSFKRFYGDGALKIEGQMYHSKYNSGVWKTYNESGKLIETTDYDAPFNLTLDEFIALVRAYHKEHDISEVSLLDNRTTITRQDKDDDKEWTFSWEAIPGRIEMLKFSDTTGEIIKVSHYELQDN